MTQTVVKSRLQNHNPRYSSLTTFSHEINDMLAWKVWQVRRDRHIDPVVQLLLLQSAEINLMTIRRHLLAIQLLDDPILPFSSFGMDYAVIIANVTISPTSTINGVAGNWTSPDPGDTR